MCIANKNNSNIYGTDCVIFYFGCWRQDQKPFLLNTVEDIIFMGSSMRNKICPIKKEISQKNNQVTHNTGHF